VLGVDEHTALVFDLDEGRRDGDRARRRHRAPPRRRGAVSRGDAHAHDVARRRRARRTAGRRSRGGAPRRGARSRRERGTATEALGAPRRGRAARAGVRGGACRAEGGEAAEAILALDRAILDWSADTLQTDEPDRARAVLHSLVHRLGEAASVGLRDPKEVLAPLVEGLIVLRAELRTEKAWQVADRLRDRLVAGGIELHDTPGGTTWTPRA
jgi:hypothetical protein